MITNIRIGMCDFSGRRKSGKLLFSTVFTSPNPNTQNAIMLNIALLILPTLAIVALLVLAIRPLVFLFNHNSLKQKAVPNSTGLRKKAVTRGQGDEYDTLIALGFESLGVYQESIVGMRELPEQYVFSHCQLPITCSLCLIPSGDLFVVMTTDGESGKSIRTSSLDAGVEFDSEDSFAQVVKDGKNTEAIFVAHCKALNELEDRGFKSLFVRSIDDAREHYLRNFKSPAIQKLLRKSFLQLAIVSVVTSLFWPALLLGMVVLIATKLKMGMSVNAMIQVYCGFSLLTSIYSWASIFLPKKTKKSSLAPSEKYTVAKETTGDSVKFSLPFRDSTDARMSAYGPCMFGIVVCMPLSFVVIMISFVSFFASVAVAICGAFV